MSPKPGGKELVYDETLLDVAPQVTQGQRQEGYDADILNPTPPPQVRSPAPPQAYNEREDLESGASANDKHLAAGGYDSVGQATKKPWWKTPKGLIILAVLAVVVIAAAVGGGVGGSLSNKNDSSSGSQQTAGPADTLSQSAVQPTTGSGELPVPGPTTSPTGGGGGGGETVANTRTSPVASSPLGTPTSSTNLGGEPVPQGPTTTSLGGIPGGPTGVVGDLLG